MWIRRIITALLVCSLSIAVVACSEGGEETAPAHIVDVSVNTEGALIIEFSDGTTEVLGVVVGQDGADGVIGQDGVTPHIGANGNWWIGDTDTGVQAKGDIGPEGVPGQDGIGFASVSVNKEGELIVERTDGSTVNAGKATHEYVGTHGLLFTAVHFEGVDVYAISGYVGTDVDVVIPSAFQGKQVVGILQEAFADSHADGGANVVVETLEVPATVKFIGDRAFYRATGLEEVIFEEDSQLETIGIRAFQYTSLIGIVIPDSVRSIESLAFANAFWLADVTFEDADNIEHLKHDAFFDTPFWNNQEGLVIIGKFLMTYAGEMDEGKVIVIPPHVEIVMAFAFFEQENLTFVHIPASVKHIEQHAFEGTTSLATVEFAANSQLESIGLFAFYESALTSIHIPASVTSIEPWAFGQTAALATVTIDAGSQLGGIGWYAFAGAALSSIHIPARVESIGGYAFAQTQNLTTVTFEENSQLKQFGPSAFFFSDLSSIHIPASVQRISANVFQDTLLASVTFEEGSQLERIDDKAFFQTLLTNVVLPMGVAHIGAEAFMSLSLESIVLPGTVIYVGDAGIKGSEDLIITVACDIAEQPTTWHANWNPDNREIVWDPLYYSE